MKITQSVLFGLALCCSLILSNCNDEGNNSPSGSFAYDVSGAAEAAVSGEDTNFGTSNGELFIRLTAGTDELIIRILVDPTVTGTYLVNPIVVNGQPQMIEEGDAFADLDLGTVLSGVNRSFSTNAGSGGSVTLSKVEGDRLEGTFNMSLQELLSSNTPPEVNIQGSFTAIKQ